jgi:uncharacterized membrane protein
VRLVALASIAGLCAIHLLPIPSPVATVFLTAQIAAIVWFATRRAWLAIPVAAVALAGLSCLGISVAKADLAVAGLCHFVAYASLLTWFALSLRRGHEPVVTRFARQLRKTMPAAVTRYTRAVTIAWAVFFAAQLLMSLTLAVTDLTVWSTFVLVWNLPSVAVMAVGEYAIRSCLFAREERTGFLATLTALRDIRP